MAFPDSTLADPWPSDGSSVNHAQLLAGTTTQLNTLVSRVSDAGWVTPTLGNSWVAYTGGTTPVGPAYRFKGGVVYVEGSMKSGTQSTTVFTFPSGLRPLHDLYFMCYAAGGAVEVAVFATGTLVVGSYVGSGASTQVALDQIRFIAEQ